MGHRCKPDEWAAVLQSKITNAATNTNEPATNGRTANRRKREDYNAYQRKLMKDRRASAKKAKRAKPV